MSVFFLAHPAVDLGFKLVFINNHNNCLFFFELLLCVQQVSGSLIESQPRPYEESTIFIFIFPLVTEAQMVKQSAQFSQLCRGEAGIGFRSTECSRPVCPTRQCLGCGSQGGTRGGECLPSMQVAASWALSLW